MYTRMHLTNQVRPPAHTQTHLVTRPRGAGDPVGTGPGVVGLQGSPRQTLAPGLCLAPSPTPSHLPSLHKEGGFCTQQELRCVLGAEESKPLGPQGLSGLPF